MKWASSASAVAWFFLSVCGVEGKCYDPSTKKECLPAPNYQRGIGLSGDTCLEDGCVGFEFTGSFSDKRVACQGIDSCKDAVFTDSVVKCDGINSCQNAVSRDTDVECLNIDSCLYTTFAQSEVKCNGAAACRKATFDQNSEVICESLNSCEELTVRGKIDCDEEKSCNQITVVGNGVATCNHNGFKNTCGGISLKDDARIKCFGSKCIDVACPLNEIRDALGNCVRKSPCDEMNQVLDTITGECLCRKGSYFDGLAASSFSCRECPSYSSPHPETGLRAGKGLLSERCICAGVSVLSFAGCTCPIFTRRNSEGKCVSDNDLPPTPDNDLPPTPELPPPVDSGDSGEKQVVPDDGEDGDVVVSVVAGVVGVILCGIIAGLVVVIYWKRQRRMSPQQNKEGAATDGHDKNGHSFEMVDDITHGRYTTIETVSRDRVMVTTTANTTARTLSADTQGGNESEYGRRSDDTYDEPQSFQAKDRDVYYEPESSIGQTQVNSVFPPQSDANHSNNSNNLPVYDNVRRQPSTLSRSAHTRKDGAVTGVPLYASVRMSTTIRNTESPHMGSPQPEQDYDSLESLK